MDASVGRGDRATRGCSLLNIFTQLAATHLVVGVASNKPNETVTFDNKDSATVVTVTWAGGAHNFRYVGHDTTPEREFASTGRTIISSNLILADKRMDHHQQAKRPVFSAELCTCLK
jgi:hypothetical protein